MTAPGRAVWFRRIGRPRDWSLGVKFPLTITAIVAGVGLTIGTAIIIQDWFRFRDTLEEKALLLAQSAAATAPEAILRSDYWSLYKSLQRSAFHTEDGAFDSLILSGMVIDTNGQVLAHLDPTSHPLALPLLVSMGEEERLLGMALSADEPLVLRGGGIGAKGFVEGVVPLFSDEKHLGVVRLRLSMSDLYRQAWRGALTAATIIATLVIVGSVLGAMISRRLVRPLTALADGMETVARGDFGRLPRIDDPGADEVGQLAASFTRMTGELQEKRRLERELAVNQKMIALGRIAAGVAHEVNSPLGGILNCVDTIRRHPDNRELVDRYLPLIEMGLNRIRAIVASLLGELRLETSMEMADASCLDDLRDLATIEIGGRPIRLEWDNRLDAGVRLYRQRVQHAILNLLRNAIQAVAAAGGGTVRFSAEQIGHDIRLRVEDDGPGIPDEQHDHLFDPFFTTRADGTGLGLWIAYRLVHSMGGRIEMGTGHAGGAVFVVVLPSGDIPGQEAPDWVI